MVLTVRRRFAAVAVMVAAAVAMASAASSAQASGGLPQCGLSVAGTGNQLTLLVNTFRGTAEVSCTGEVSQILVDINIDGVAYNANGCVNTAGCAVTTTFQTKDSCVTINASAIVRGGTPSNLAGSGLACVI